MHVPWGCIKQRTQFIAEGLLSGYDIAAVYKKEYIHQVNNEKTVTLIPLFRFPYERVRLIRIINTILYKIQLKNILKKFEMVWITHPSLISILPVDEILSKELIYDCMDDMLEFPNTDEAKLQIKRDEELLYHKANIVFCSAEYLKRKLQRRYGMREIFVVNNALSRIDDSPKTLPTRYARSLSNKAFKVVYIGTISAWFDIKLLNYLEKEMDNIEFYLYGPLESANISLPKSDRIHYEGCIDHQYVNALMEHADALIMPFVINELILSVNPVKLYEYIYSGKPCLAPRYGESEKFNSFVYLYDSYKDCSEILAKIQSGVISAKQDKESCIAFARDNTWDNRMKYILQVLENTIS